MTYTKLPDELNEDGALIALSDGAFRLWIAALVDANRRLSDGYVVAARLSMIVPRFRKTQVRELVAAGEWEAVDGGYRIRRFFDHQLSREQILELREKRSESGKRGAESRWHGKGHGKSDGTGVANGMASDMASPRQTDGKADAPYPVPRTPSPVTHKDDDGRSSSSSVDQTRRAGLRRLDPTAALAAVLP